MPHLGQGWVPSCSQMLSANACCLSPEQPEPDSSSWERPSDRQRDGPTILPFGDPWPQVGGTSAKGGVRPKEKEMGGTLDDPPLLLEEVNLAQHSFMHLFSGSINKHLLRTCCMLSPELSTCGKEITVCGFYIYGAIHTCVRATTY